MNFEKICIKENINLYYFPTNKFKTTSVGFYIKRPLCREECTKNALLSMILKRSCPRFEKSTDLLRYLDNLYGVSFQTNVHKKGEMQIISANFQFINDKFIDDDIDILGSVLDLSGDCLLNQKSFNEEYLSQEKENLKSQIMSVINDKRSYASKRCIEIMCKDEPYGISSIGYVDDIDKITAEDLISHYRDTFIKSPVDIFVTGDADIKRVAEKIKNMYFGIDVTEDAKCSCDVKKDVIEVKNTEEEQPVAQGKLCMGFRTNTFITDADYPALMMYNAILGCGIFSKLFNNVREKLSLCYYASSSIISLKGIMTINSGIEVKNFKRAYDEILLQMDDIKNGKISETEMSAALLGTINLINSVRDNPVAVYDYFLGGIISGDLVLLDTLAEKIRNVKKEDIVKVSEKIRLDTVYFLKGCENNEF